ncbi:hypothetical protein NRE35_004381 [Salmonella enterica]|nr:hypothetical protein [Escherichia coli]EJO2544015.1 hypothetical protein [Salmonella enterica]ELF5188677.1 hypothetical protein [Salmonella enterica]
METLNLIVTILQYATVFMMMVGGLTVGLLLAALIKFSDLGVGRFNGRLRSVVNEKKKG